MPVRLSAQTVSRPVAAQLRAGPIAGRVLAVSARACNLLVGDQVVALVTHKVGAGPLNVVLTGRAGLFDEIRPGMAATLSAERIDVGGLRAGLVGAAIWEPRPDWRALRAERGVVCERLPILRAALCQAPTGSFLALLEPLQGSLFEVAGRQALAALRAGWAGDTARLREGVTGLAGLGGGLTPAGDDLLCGWMLGAWLAHPAPAPFCQAIVVEGAWRTTTLAAAFLRAAARGECSAAWQALLDALAGVGAGPDRSPRPVRSAIFETVAGVLAHGATSGADGLAGFLSACQCAWGAA